jgi:hypothetical protein
MGAAQAHRRRHFCLPPHRHPVQTFLESIVRTFVGKKTTRLLYINFSHVSCFSRFFNSEQSGMMAFVVPFLSFSALIIGMVGTFALSV